MLSSSTHASRCSKREFPKADFYTSDEQLLIVLDMPGVSQEDLLVNSKHGHLYVEGHSSDSQRTVRERSFRISESYDTSRTTATVEHGVVRLEIPKRPEAKTVRIPVVTA